MAESREGGLLKHLPDPKRVGEKPNGFLKAGEDYLQRHPKDPWKEFDNHPAVKAAHKVAQKIIGPSYSNPKPTE